MKKFRQSFAIACLTLFVAAATAVAGDEKLAPELRNAAPAVRANSKVEVIVQYKVTPTAAHHQRVADLGGTLLTKMDFIKAGHYTLPASAVKSLAADPDVAYITPNRSLRGMMDIPAETVNDSAAIGGGYNGSGIGVAVIDSGIAALPDFQNRIVYQQSFVGGSAADQWGHGTHVSGLLGSSGNGTVFTGIVPDVNLINLRVLDPNGNGTDAEVISALDTAIQLKNQYKIRVINLSLGRPVFESASKDPLCQAVEAAWKAGIVVVAAAGTKAVTTRAGTLATARSPLPATTPT